MHQYQGSSKNLYFYDDSTGTMEFLDYYSVFDWGRMPNTIPNKGKMLKAMGKAIFEQLSRPEFWQQLPLESFGLHDDTIANLHTKGMTTHYLGDSDDNRLQFKTFPVYTPKLVNEQYDYAAYQHKPKRFVIPLEFIFRFGCPKGSSLLKRDPNFYEGQRFDEPLIDITTKFEDQDRQLTIDQGIQLACLSVQEWQTLYDNTKALAWALNYLFDKKGILLWDGKFEWAIERTIHGYEIVFVDAIGPDEVRLQWQDIILSKELLRQFYTKTPWANALSVHKKLTFDWKADFKTHYRYPMPLAQPLIDYAAHMYASICQAAIEAFSFDFTPFMFSLERPILKKVFLVGQGGRESALYYSLENDPSIDLVGYGPKSLGQADADRLYSFASAQDLLKICQHHQIEAVIVGPEDYFINGYMDAITAQGIQVLGPSKANARLEGSKAYAKDIMQQAGIATSEYIYCPDKTTIHQHLDTLHQWFRQDAGIVIKVDKPCAGKGVFVLTQWHDVLAEIEAYNFSELGPCVIERMLSGKEISYFALCAGVDFSALGCAQDYKRLSDGDTGPNTGGMGAIVTNKLMPDGLETTIHQEILMPLLKTMQALDSPYKGWLFIGLMLTEQGPKVLEFNVRLGDPETQALLPLINDSWYHIIEDYAQAKFTHKKINTLKAASIHVVVASQGYANRDQQPLKLGQRIDLKSDLSYHTFLANVTSHKTTQDDTYLVNTGGRVLGLTAVAAHLDEARKKAYAGLSHNTFVGAQYRKDIGT